MQRGVNRELGAGVTPCGGQFEEDGERETLRKAGRRGTGKQGALSNDGEGETPKISRGRNGGTGPEDGLALAGASSGVGQRLSVPVWATNWRAPKLEA